MTVDIKKCKKACDLILTELSHGEQLPIKFELYHELVNLIDEYEQLQRVNFGLKQTIKNLKEKLYKYNDSYGYNK